jgi:large subunit ribosomal protein L35
MVICAVDHSHLHIFAPQFFCSLKPAKTCADDDDARFSCGRIFHTASFWQTFNVQRLTSNIQFSVGARLLAAPAETACCQNLVSNYVCRLMPKPIARSKTRKAVAKRFKITARGKALRAHSSRRHLLSAKNAKRKRRLSKAACVDNTDVARIMANLPFG